MKKNVIYVRQSLKENMQKYSIEIQEAECLDVAATKGLVIHDIYNEGDCSARKNNIQARPKLYQLILDAQQGLIGNLIVYKRDRLARNTEQYLEILEQLLFSKVTIHFAADNEPPLYSGPIGNFVETVLAGIAEYEGENINKRLIQSRKLGMGNGKWMAGRPPAYYEIQEDKSLYISDENKVFIKTIYTEFSKCKNVTLSKIGKEMKFRNPTLKHVKYNLRTIIPREIHKGLLVQSIEGVSFSKLIESLRCVSDEEWEEANKLWLKLGLEQEEEQEQFQTLFSDRIMCGSCCRLLKKGTIYYSCSTCEEKVEIRVIEQKLLRDLFGHLQHQAKIKEEELKEKITYICIRPIQIKIDASEKEITKLQLYIEESIFKYLYKKNEREIQDLVKQYKAKVEHVNILYKSKSVLEEKIKLLNMMKLQKIHFEKLSAYQKGILIHFVKHIRVENQKYDVVLSYK